ncbi:hypothetical protein CHUAL_013000 [Chamberlinius hualienensis]
MDKLPAFQLIFVWFILVGSIGASADSGNNIQSEGPCKFDIYLATCRVYVQNMYPVEMTVIFNHCHKPTDITFVLKAENQNLDWKYTYVTTNVLESPEIVGFLPDRIVSLRVDMRNDGEHAINVFADFQVDGVADATVMNTTVHMTTQNNCSALGAENIGRILLGVLLTSVLAILFVGVVIHTCVRKVRKNAKCERFPLVDDAESVARASTSFTITPDTPLEPFTVLGASHSAETPTSSTANGFAANSKYNPRT